MKHILLGKSVEEIRQLLTKIDAAVKLPSYLAKQIAEWIYRKHAVSFDEMTNISAANRVLLKEYFSIGITAPSITRISKDGTQKFLFSDVEAVLIPDGERLTLCVSSQAGCKMNCTFCATGKMGFGRNLSAAEILNQYAFLTSSTNSGEKATGSSSITESGNMATNNESIKTGNGTHIITNIVFMGMGEPLDNLSEVLTALHTLTADWGFALSPRRITVSTVGIIPALQQIIEQTQCHIAISLHNPYHEQRLMLVPVEKTYTLEDVLALLSRYDWAHQRKLSFEYFMLGGLNDSLLHAKTLVRLVRDLPCHINLIPYHSHSNLKFTSSPRKNIEAFQNILTEKNITCTLRTSRGQDIEAACGLLATNVR
jgi:23S rRNA (adenine2503-C2)-methyltransferase